MCLPLGCYHAWMIYPAIDPIIFSIGPVSVRWYGLMYVIGFIAAWRLARARAAQPNSTWTPQLVDDLIFYCAVGVILGGRLGWVLFYGIEDIIREPTRILRIWEGGMSIHGGVIGVIIAMSLFARSRGRAMGDIYDFTAPLPSIGFMMGRIGNFINGELWGKPTTLPWGMVLDADKLNNVQAQEVLSLCARFEVYPCRLQLHPSQLYQSFLEGLMLFIIVWIFTSKPRPRYAAGGMFMLFYGLFRFIAEFVRIPDQNRGYLLFDWMTMGQILSVPMIILGVILLVVAYRLRVPSGNYTSDAAAPATGRPVAA